jgi:hypothetical protein
LAIIPVNANQIKLYSKYVYTPKKSDAGDASDAFTATSLITKKPLIQRSKPEQAGRPDLPCIYCSYFDCIEFDLSLHYIEKHRQNLIRLPIGKGSIDDRADYVVELSKKRLFESLDDNEDEDNENESDE